MPDAATPTAALTDASGPAGGGPPIAAGCQVAVGAVVGHRYGGLWRRLWQLVLPLGVQVCALRMAAVALSAAAAEGGPPAVAVAAMAATTKTAEPGLCPACDAAAMRGAGGGCEHLAVHVAAAPPAPPPPLPPAAAAARVSKNQTASSAALVEPQPVHVPPALAPRLQQTIQVPEAIQLLPQLQRPPPAPPTPRPALHPARQAPGK